MLKLAKNAKSAIILVFTTFNYLIMVQYKIFFEISARINIFRDDQFLLYWDIVLRGHEGQYPGFPTFW